MPLRVRTNRENRHKEDFGLGDSNRKLHAMTPSEIFEERLFRGQGYQRARKPGPILARKPGPGPTSKAGANFGT